MADHLSLFASLKLLKIPLLVCAMRIAFAGFTPPTAPARAEDKEKYKQVGKDPLVPQTTQVKMVNMLRVRPVFVRSHHDTIAEYLQVCVWTMIACEAVALVASVYHTDLSSYVAKAIALHPTGVTSVAFTPATIVGMLLLVAGGSIRLSCYRTLGKHFTWDLTVHKDHTLITEGLYSVVRHPAYVGSIASFAGITLAMLGRGSWFAECIGWGTLPGMFVGGAWLLFAGAISSALVQRPAKEDVVLRKEFGAQWVEYARNVPYRLVPYVY